MSKLDEDESRGPEESAMQDKADKAENQPVQGEVVAAQPKQETAVAERKAFTLRDTQATNFLNPEVYLQMKAMSNDLIKSKAIPTNFINAEQVLVALQTGYEMGMKPMESLKSLYVVNGQINVWGAATVRRLREHGFTIEYSEESENKCTAKVVKREGVLGEHTSETYTETYTFEEAEESGFTKDNSGRLKVGWRKGINRKLKLRYGVLSIIIKTYIPEVLGAAADIVEVAQDYVIDETPDDKALMQAAEEKRKEVAAGKKNGFTPTVVTPTEEKTE